MKDKTYIHIRLNKNLQQMLKEEAEKNGMSLNAYVNLIFQKRKI